MKQRRFGMGWLVVLMNLVILGDKRGREIVVNLVTIVKF